MDSATQVQILNVYISYCTNTLGKVMNSTICPPAMGLLVGQIGLFNLAIATGLEGKL